MFIGHRNKVETCRRTALLTIPWTKTTFCLAMRLGGYMPPRWTVDSANAATRPGAETSVPPHLSQGEANVQEEGPTQQRRQAQKSQCRAGSPPAQKVSYSREGWPIQHDSLRACVVMPQQKQHQLFHAWVPHKLRRFSSCHQQHAWERNGDANGIQSPHPTRAAVAQRHDCAVQPAPLGNAVPGASSWQGVAQMPSWCRYGSCCWRSAMFSGVCRLSSPDCVAASD